MKKIILIVSVLFFMPFLASAATLSLSPSGGGYNVGDIISVNILLDTQGAPVQGADIRHLNYNPALLEAQDENTGIAGVQITPGTLMPTMANSVDTANGKILFAQAISGSGTFTGSGTLATARFKVLASGAANLNFNFTPGDTSDTNVAYDAVDLLTSVGNASYALVIPPPPTQFPTLFLSPSSAQERVGEVFPVRIYLDTKGWAIDGVDVKIRFDNSRLIVDSIATGSLLPNTTANSYDNNPENILFSQTTNGDSVFSGNGTLVTIYFKALSEGTTSVYFDFIKGRTTDTNVSLGGADLLDSVVNGNDTIIPNGLAPIISNPQPTGAIYLPRILVLEVSANELATCRYGFAPGIAYDSMSRSFRASSDGLTHTASLTSGFQLGRNNFYVRCRDKDRAPMTSQSDFLISFDIISDTVAPFISNPQPTGTFFMPRSLPLKISTNEAATCRHSLTLGVSYDLMRRYFRASSDGLTHTAGLTSGLQIGQNTIYARCRDRSGVNSDQVDSPISFILIAPPKLVAGLEGLPNPSSVNVTVSISKSGTGAPVATFSDH